MNCKMRQNTVTLTIFSLLFFNQKINKTFPQSWYILQKFQVFYLLFTSNLKLGQFKKNALIQYSFCIYWNKMSSLLKSSFRNTKQLYLFQILSLSFENFRSVQQANFHFFKEYKVKENIQRNCRREKFYLTVLVIIISRRVMIRTIKIKHFCNPKSRRGPLRFVQIFSPVAQ